MKRLRNGEPVEPVTKQQVIEIPPVEAPLEAPWIGPTGKQTDQQHVIEELQRKIEVLEARFISIGEIAGDQAARAATEAVEGLLDARHSELFAHILDLQERVVLIAKKTTKWCVVCFSKENTYAFLPCRHKCVCRDCAKKTYDRFKKCPICRMAITSAKPIYDLSAMDTE